MRPLPRFVAGDPLRALAALAVLGYHAANGAAAASGHINKAEAFGAVPGHLAEAGRYGIYVFFALSGYLLSRPFLRGSAPDLLPYLRARLLRIVPAFWVVTSLTLLWFGTRGAQPNEIAAIYGFVQTYASSDASALMVQAWTLDVELVFYVLLPILAAALAGRRAPVVVAVVAGLALGSLWLKADRPFVDSWQQGFPAMLFAFAPGVALAAWEAKLPRHGGIALMALDVAALAAAGWTETTQQLLRGALGAAGGGLILAGALARERRPVLDHAVLHSLGRWSYSIYLIHVPVLFALAERAPDLGPTAMLAYLLGVGLVLTLALSALCYRFVERPFVQWRYAAMRVQRSGAPS